MEAIAMLGGLTVLLLGVVALMFMLTLAIPVWETWWLHPLWATVIVPLGVPQISYWHLFAVNVFVCALFIPQQHAEQKDDEKENYTFAAKLFVAFVRPVLAYYAIRWAFA